MIPYNHPMFLQFHTPNFRPAISSLLRFDVRKLKKTKNFQLDKLDLVTHSLAFCNRFILVRLTVDPGPVSGNLGVRQEHTLGRVNANTHSHLRAIYLSQCTLLACYWEETHVNTRANMHRNSTQTLT